MLCKRMHLLATCGMTLMPVVGCHQRIVNDSDREVYGIIEDRQRSSLGRPAAFTIESETRDAGEGGGPYDLNPHPVSPLLPESFSSPRKVDPVAEDDAAGRSFSGDAHLSAESDISPSIFAGEDRERVQLFGPSDTIAYATGRARTLQDAKEALYLAALDLALERHLWTPQFVGSIQGRADYSDPGGLRDADRAFQTISELSLTQRLPYGGSVSARVISTLLRDLQEHVTSGETGSLILSADVPLLRGAGRSAYESRYAAERELIYAVRTYERFRREFLVEVAGNYFSLQQSKAAIRNTFTAYESRVRDWEKADFINRMGRSRSIFEAPRAKSSLRQAESALVSAKERHATALDRFKIFLGMPVGELLDVVDQDEDQESGALDELLPEVDVPSTIELAVLKRLDLLNEQDRVDDARRGVHVAGNRLLPDLDFTAGVTFDSDPARLNSASFNTERNKWESGLELRLDDRKTERNAYRAALVALRKAERDYEQSVDLVIADVRRAVRRIAQQENLRRIQALNVSENEFRLEAARAQFDLGKTTNQDVVDAENDLLAARNDYAAAVAEYRNAILEFRLSTGTLRVADDGTWERPKHDTGQPAD